MARNRGISKEFREITLHPREMHDLLVDALVEYESLATEDLLRLEDWSEDSIANLEILAALPDGKPQ